MAKLIFVGDLHIRKDAWAKKAVDGVFNVLLERAGKGDTIFFLGDVFNTSRPYPEEIAQFNEFLERSPADIAILMGNHEYLDYRDTFAEEIYKSSKRVDVIDTPVERTYGVVGVVCLPFIPLHRLMYQYHVKTLADVYSGELGDKLAKESVASIKDSQVRFLAYHFEDETQFMGIDRAGVNLGCFEKVWPDIKRIGGHVHRQVRNYLGTPYQTRADEMANGRGRYVVVDTESGKTGMLEFPWLVKFDSISFGEQMHRPTSDTTMMLKVVDAPSYEAVKERYGDNGINGVYIRDFELTAGMQRDVDGGSDTADGKSIRDMLEDFIVANDVDKVTSDYLRSVM